MNKRIVEVLLASTKVESNEVETEAVQTINITSILMANHQDAHIITAMPTDAKPSSIDSNLRLAVINVTTAQLVTSVRNPPGRSKPSILEKWNSAAECSNSSVINQPTRAKQTAGNNSSTRKHAAPVVPTRINTTSPWK
jgi:hypothetical protein